eukprot:g4213.t1
MPKNKKVKKVKLGLGDFLGSVAIEAASELPSAPAQRDADEDRYMRKESRRDYDEPQRGDLDDAWRRGPSSGDRDRPRGGFGDRNRNDRYASRDSNRRDPDDPEMDDPWRRKKPVQPPSRDTRFGDDGRSSSRGFGSRSERRGFGSGYDRSNGFESRDGPRRRGFGDRSREREVYPWEGRGLGDSRGPPQTRPEGQRLQLSKRSKPVPKLDVRKEKPKANPFGEAKAVDTKKIFESQPKKVLSDSSKPLSNRNGASPSNSKPGKKEKEIDVVDVTEDGNDQKENEYNNNPRSAGTEKKTLQSTKEKQSVSVETSTEKTGEEEKKKERKSSKSKNSSSRRGRRAPEVKNTRWAESPPTSTHKKRIQILKKDGENSNVTPRVVNSRWSKSEEDAEKPKRIALETPTIRNSRWDKDESETDRAGMSGRIHLEAPTVKNSRWGKDERDEFEPLPPRDSAMPPKHRNTRWEDDREERAKIDEMMRYGRDGSGEAQAPRNSRWANDSDDNARARSQPRQQNNRMDGIHDSNRRVESSSSSSTSSPVKEKTPEELKKEAELDARIKAIRERNRKNKGKTLPAGVKLDPFGNPIDASKQRAAKQPSKEEIEREARERALDERMKAIRAKNAAIKAGTWVEPGTSSNATNDVSAPHKGSDKLAALEAAVGVAQGPEMPAGFKPLLADMGVTEADREALALLPEARRSRLESRTKSMIREYLAGHDVKEFILCLEELECKAYYETVLMEISRACLEGFKQSERDGMKKLLPVLRESTIDGACLLSVLNRLAMAMGDISMDAPNAPKYFKEIFGEAVVSTKLVTASLLCPEAEVMLSAYIPEEEALEVTTGVAALPVNEEVKSLIGGGATGKALRKLVKGKEGTDVLLAVLLHLYEKANQNPEKMIGKNEDDEDCIVEMSEDGPFCRALTGTVGKADVEGQKQAVFVAQAFCNAVNFPGRLCECIFMTLYDADIVSEEGFFAWRDDKSVTLGRVEARKQTLEWLTWLEENADDESDSESDEE